MIEPAKAGQALLDEIGRTAAACRLGRHLVARSERVPDQVERGDRLAIDPYLSEHLTTKYAGNEPPPRPDDDARHFEGASLTGIDLVLASHKHSDHLDPDTIPDLLNASPNAVLVLPAPLLDHAEGLGVRGDRLIGMDASSHYEFPGVTASDPSLRPTRGSTPTRRDAIFIWGT